jgi:hypothetical protein
VQITRNSIETGRGPSDWFTGAVHIDAVAAPSNGSRISASSVHFTPGARTAWHTHPNGSAPTRFMTHPAMLEVDEEGNPATWGEHVTDEEYGAAPAIDS